MKQAYRQAVEEVIEALMVHRAVIVNNHDHGARISKGTMKDMVDGMDISISKLSRVLKAEKRSDKEPGPERIFIVAPNGGNTEDHRHDVCKTTSKLSLLDVYSADLYEVLGERQSLPAAKRLAIKLGAKHPAVI